MQLDDEHLPVAGESTVPQRCDELGLFLRHHLDKDLDDALSKVHEAPLPLVIVEADQFDDVLVQLHVDGVKTKCQDVEDWRYQHILSLWIGVIEKIFVPSADDVEDCGHPALPINQFRELESLLLVFLDFILLEQDVSHTDGLNAGSHVQR